MAVRTETEGIRKKQIMQATRDVIAEKGLDRTTMRDIGQRAGMSAAIVCYYFEDKKRLMKETLADASAVHRGTFETIIASEQPPLEKFKAAMKENLPISGANHREWRLWLDYWAEAARDPELRTFIAESETRFRGSIARIIEQGVEAGVFRSDVPPAVLAAGVVGMIEGLGIMHIMDPNTMTIESIVESTVRYVQRC